MRLLLATFLLLGAISCSRDVELGREDPGSTGTTASGSCRTAGECPTGALCVNQACVTPEEACAPGAACASQGGLVCTGTCPTCGGAPPCCVDNGFGSCSCFCGVSCAGPPCAAAGTDAGPILSPQCSGDGTCLCGEHCQAQVCGTVEQRVACLSTSECLSANCGAGFACVGGSCVPPGWLCQNARECGGTAAGFVCEGGQCLCVDRSPAACSGDGDCTACTGKVCRGGSCQVPFSTSTGNASATGSSGAGSSSSTSGSGSSGSGSGSGSTSGSTGH
jgi:hypothetical protein